MFHVSLLLSLWQHLNSKHFESHIQQPNVVGNIPSFDHVSLMCRAGCHITSNLYVAIKHHRYHLVLAVLAVCSYYCLRTCLGWINALFKCILLLRLVQMHDYESRNGQLYIIH